MAVEIERKFLVAAEWAVPEGARRAHIRQAYLTSPGSTPEIRVRAVDDERLMTVKAARAGAASGAAVRTEIEFPLDAAVFDQLWAIGAADSVDKVRWTVPIGDDEATVDVYEGRHAGLRVVEVEFADVARAEAFEPPDWFGEEVTGRAEWGNRALARGPAPEA